MQPSLLVAVALAGSAGALCRYLVGLWITSWWPGLPLATAVVNVLGCLLFGGCWAVASGRWSPPVAAAVFVGFFGAFTTFSSFVFECQELLAEGRHLLFALNALGQNVLGFAALMAGLGLGGLLRA